MDKHTYQFKTKDGNIYTVEAENETIAVVAMNEKINYHNYTPQNPFWLIQVDDLPQFDKLFYFKDAAARDEFVEGDYQEFCQNNSHKIYGAATGIEYASLDDDFYIEPKRLRDEFAMAALQGILSNPAESSGISDEQDAVEAAYFYANAMMERRKKK